MSYRETASLTADLLAVKGMASPATDLYRIGHPLPPKTAPPAGADVSPRPAARPAKRVSLRAPVEGAAAPARDRVKLSLRLDAEQHRRLRLLAAHLGLSRQALLEQALESYGAAMVPAVRDGTCACLAPMADLGKGSNVAI